MSNPTAVVRPSFFKPLKNISYSTELRLPLGFARKHRNILPENAKLKIRSGLTWTVKIKRPEDEEDCYFTEGWSDFVKDLGLQGMKMLLFWFNEDDETFDVSVYDSDSNELEFSVAANPSNGSSSDDDVVVVEGGRNVCKLPRYQFKLTKTCRYNVILRKRFVTAAGLIGITGDVVLQYLGRERRWKAVLKQVESNDYILTKGWNDFRLGNKLVLGKIYSFQFDVANNLILVSDDTATSESTKMKSNFNTTTSENCECSSRDHVWRFVRELKLHHFLTSRLDMPKSFAKSMGLAAGSDIYLENSQGKKWLVTITDRNLGMFSMTHGVTEVLRENHMQIGDILLFESVPDFVERVIKFKVMENEAGKEMLARSKMGGIVLN